MTTPTWEPPAGYREVYELWTSAWHRIETFDQLVMSGRRPENGHAVPVNSAEQREGQAHARKVITETERLAAQVCPDQDTRDSAKRAASRAHDQRIYTSEPPQ